MTTFSHSIASFLLRDGEPLVGLSLPFVYDTRQPYEVTVHIRDTRFVVPRAILNTGRYRPCRAPGAWVGVFPQRRDPRWTHIDLYRPEDRSQVAFQAVFLSTFLDVTYDLVPSGREAAHLQVPSSEQMDSELERLLAGAT